jgi:pimeloyl-[acyl-carrier protein] synthase
MSLNARMFNIVSKVALAVLGRADHYLNGSNSGRSAEQVRQDPYSGFQQARARGPVLRSYANRGWMVVGFEAAQACFKDQRFGSDMRRNKFLVRLLRAGANGRPVSPLDNPSMLNLDAPDHTRLRKLASRGFLNKYIQSLRPHIEEIVGQCLADIEEGTEQFDVVEKLANELPAIVIAEMLGLPEKDRAQFQAWSNDLIGLTKIEQPALVERAGVASEELQAYLAGIIDSKRTNPGEDFITQLIAAEEEGDRLNADEMYSTCALLLGAGHETTTRLIGNGLYLLLKHPEQLAMLRKDRSLMDNAIEEMLRYEPPVQFMPRFAREDLEFYGNKVKKDQLLLVVIASANRDETANPESEKFDITRENVKHVSFGHGMHLCLGLALARMEASVAFNALLDRFPNMSMSEQDVVWSDNAFVRGVEKLMVECGEPVRTYAPVTLVTNDGGRAPLTDLDEHRAAMANSPRGRAQLA